MPAAELTDHHGQGPGEEPALPGDRGAWLVDVAQGRRARGEHRPSGHSNRAVDVQERGDTSEREGTASA